MYGKGLKFNPRAGTTVLALMAQAIRKPPRSAVFDANAIGPLCVEGLLL